MRKRYIVSVIVGICGLLSAEASAQNCSSSNVLDPGFYKDIKTGTHEDTVTKVLHQKGIMEGCNADQFCPNCGLTRAQAALYIGRARGLNVTSCNSSYTDVTTNTVSLEECGMIAALEKEKYSVPVTSTTFEPNR